MGYSWREYGNRVGVWRLLALFDELQFPCSLLANSACFSHCPQVVAAFKDRGCEVVGHGRTNSEMQGGMSLEEERMLIKECMDVAVEAVGEQKRLTGWLGPWISESENTPD